MKTLALLLLSFVSASAAEVGVGAKPIDGAEVIFDGSRKMLDGKWIYWEGAAFRFRHADQMEDRRGYG